jgi:hypothetical protein
MTAARNLYLLSGLMAIVNKMFKLGISNSVDVDPKVLEKFV